MERRRSSPRLATAALFFINGAVVGSWVAHIPFVQERFDFSKGTLGLAILAMSAGVILALPVMGEAIVRLGSLRAVRLTGLACCALLPLPLLAPDPLLLPLALLVFGAAAGAMDVSMNAHGVALEEALERPIMSSLHAGWSFGGFAGAGMAGVATAAGVDPRLQVAVAAAALLAALLACLPRLGPGAAGTGVRTGFARPSRGVVLLAALCLLIMLTEGAMADWSALYLREIGAVPGVAATGFAAFAAGMTIARLTGDALNRRLGPVRLLRGGAAAAAVALGALLTAGEPVVALAGFVLVGAGVANGVPLLFSAAGRAGGERAGPAIAAVSSMGSIGFLAGPPFIGFLADGTSLPIALATLCAGLAAVTLLGGRACGDLRAPTPAPAELAVR